MKRKKQIGTEILKAFLLIITAALLITVVFCEIDLQIMNARVNDNMVEIGNKASESSESLLIEQALGDSAQLVTDKSMIAENQLSSIADMLGSISDYASYIYAHGGEFKPQTVRTAQEVVDAGEGDGMSMQYALSPGVEFASVRNEIYLQGNLLPLFIAMQKTYPTVTSFYTGAATGFTVGYDASAAAKAPYGIYYEAREREWYTSVMESGKIYISGTYSDSFGRGLTVTMAMPIYNGDEFVGAIGVDVLIEQLNRDILGTTVGENGYAILYSDNSVISAPGLTEENKENISAFLGNGFDSLTFTEAGDAKYARTELNGKSVYVILSTIKLTGWTYAVVLPVDDIIAPAVEAREAIQTIITDARASINSLIILSNILLVIFFAAIVAAAVFITRKVSVKISSPIVRLTEEVDKIGDGNLDYISHIDTGDEIETLSHSFENMTVSLKEYIANLSAVTAEKERIGAELNVATQIQASMLPCIFPAFPSRKEFDIYASMHPAKEVGGDFYDFFLIDDNHLGVVIADVSGKGVPAALFMVIAKTLIKNQTQYNKSPAEVFNIVNTQLCENNQAGMFVTAFMGILDIQTGRFVYANAGHNHPLVLKNGEGYEWLKARAGFVLAGMEGVKYTDSEITLGKGDILYLYTDGVTEALNDKLELYGDDRLINTLNKDEVKPLKATELIEYMKADIAKYANGAEQADDITMVALMFGEHE